MTIGERIKALRKERGMTQKQVADRCGMADSALRKYESGKVTPKQGMLQRIAEALHTTPAYLMGWTDDWYDYEKDEDDRFCQIPASQFHALMETYGGDLEDVWRAWLVMQESAYEESARSIPAQKAPSYSDGAMKLAKDYDSLDPWGQKQVRDVADNELARTKAYRLEIQAAAESGMTNQVPYVPKSDVTDTPDQEDGSLPL